METLVLTFLVFLYYLLLDILITYPPPPILPGPIPSFNLLCNYCTSTYNLYHLHVYQCTW